MNGDGVAELQRRFPHYSFRAYPNGRCEPLRWQCGVVETERREGATCNGYVTDMEVEIFKLIAHASTPEELAKRVAKLPPPPQRAWQELIG